MDSLVTIDELKFATAISQIGNAQCVLQVVASAIVNESVNVHFIRGALLGADQLIEEALNNLAQ